MTSSVDELPQSSSHQLARARAARVTDTGVDECLEPWGNSGKKDFTFPRRAGEERHVAHGCVHCLLGCFGICGSPSSISPGRLSANASVVLANISIENSSFMFW